MGEWNLETITYNNRGIFINKTRKLSVKQIMRRRARLQRDILRARERLRYWTITLPKLEAKLKELNSDTFNNYIKATQEQEQHAAKKAESLLKEFVGEKQYQTIQEKGHLLFQAKDGMTYEIEKGGRVFRKTSNGLEQLCIIRPSDLPLPDFITSMFVNIRESPTKYPKRR